MIENLTEENFILYAAQNYDRPYCVNTTEFYSDLKLLKYIKRWINRYLETKNLKIQLLLNHIITFYNIFQHEAATKILFFKMDESAYPVLKTILLYLNYLPEYITSIRGQVINTSNIGLDNKIASALKDLR